MRLSVVVPAYNVEHVIGRTVGSLLHQTMPPHEVIVVDDGSTDQTAEIVNRLAESVAPPHCVRLLQQENRGVSAARNAGLAVATGDYVLFLDGDDWVSPSMVATVMTSAVGAPDLIHWKFKQVDESGQSTGVFDSDWTLAWPDRGPDMLTCLLNGSCRWLWIGATVWKVDFLRERDLTFTVGCATAEDSEFMWSALMDVETALFIDEAMTSYLLRVGSVSQSSDLRLLDGCLAYFRLADKLQSARGADWGREVDSLVDRAIDRYFYVIDRTARVGNMNRLFRQIEMRAPGVTSLVHQSLARRRSGGAHLPKRQLLFLLLPVAGPHISLARRYSSRLGRGGGR